MAFSTFFANPLDAFLPSTRFWRWPLTAFFSFEGFFGLEALEVVPFTRRVSRQLSARVPTDGHVHKRSHSPLFALLVDACAVSVFSCFD